MPYGISNKQADCEGWATVKQEADGSYSTLYCHGSKQDAIDQMIAASLDEDMEPLGEVRSMISTEKRSEEMLAFIDAAMGLLEKAKQYYVMEESEPEDEPEEEMDEEEMRAINLGAPAFMRASAKRGLALHEEGLSGEGLLPQTVEDARKMAAGDVSEAKWRKIPAWISRHTSDLDAVQGDEVTPGLVAMLLWGGGSTKASARRAQEYAERIVERLEADK